jgi:hypothetical protein
MDYFIYKIVLKDKPEFIYVGHTKNFSNRKKYHKHGCMDTPHRKLYSTINENGGWENCEMILIEHIVGMKTDARIKENYWYETLKANLNVYKPFTTHDEKKEQMKLYYETHKEDMKEKMKEYRENNHEAILEKKKEYYYNHKEEDNKRSKEYRETHKEEVKEYKKKWYDENKERLSHKNNEKLKCECGKEYTRSNQSRHLKTKFHIDFICKQSQE